MKKVLITGCSSGFGFLTAQTLVQEGFCVFATMRALQGRNRNAADKLLESCSLAKGRLHFLELDVTDDASVEAAISSAISLEGAVDVVVNNAAYGHGGFVEALTVEQFRGILETNLLGVHRVNRAVLPHMRARGSGLLIHVSSVLGRIVVPFSGAYVASKFALEGLAQTYHYELAGTGVESVIIEPGGFLTGYDARRVHPADTARVDSYGSRAQEPEEAWQNVLQMLGEDVRRDPQAVARAIFDLIQTPTGQRPLRTVIDPWLETPIRGLNASMDAVQNMVQEGMADEDGSPE